MNPILEEGSHGSAHDLFKDRSAEGSMASLATSSARSGIKMGSVSLGPRPQRMDKPMFRPLDPSSMISGISAPMTTNGRGTTEDLAYMVQQGLNVKSQVSQSDSLSDEDDDTEESDWEQEVTNDGNVHFIEPFTTEEASGLVQRMPVMPNPPRQSNTMPEDGGKRLSRLVRRRESKRDRNASANVVLKTPSGSDPNRWRVSNSHDSTSDNDSSTYGQIKTFEAFFETTNLDRSVASPAPPRQPEIKDEVTEIHEVTLKFQTKQLKAQIPHFQMLLHGENPANRGLLLEALLGIVPQAKPYTAVNTRSVIDNSVVIASLVPQGVASKCNDNLKCGDIIRSLDGHHITLDTVNTFLLNKLTKASSSAGTGKVKLILQRPTRGRHNNQTMAPITEADLTAKRDAITKHYSELDDHAWSLLYSANVGAAIISNSGLEDSSSSDAPAVMYLMPSNQDEKDSPIINVRGIFSTLVQLLPDIVSSSPLSSSLLLRVAPKSGPEAEYSTSQEQIHVAFAADGDEILFVGFPASRVSDRQGTMLVQQMVRFLKLKHGSLLKAALGSSQDLNNVIGRLIYETLFGRAMRSELSRDLQAFISEAPMLNLPDDIQFQVEDALNQFESCDFQDFSDEFYDLPREFIVTGSCIFHRGYVIASHLSRENLCDIQLWLKCTNVADLTREHPVRKVVLWHELNIADSNTEDQYRRFLLVSGLGYQLLGVILEVGGCTADSGNSVSPDPFYVDQAVNTLEHLSEMGIPLVCEKWLTLPHNPSLLDIDNVISASTKVKKLDLKSDPSGQNPSIVSTGGGVVLKRTKSLELSESSSATSESPSPGHHRLDKNSDTNSGYEMSTAFRGEEKDDSSSNWELPRGRRVMTSIRSSASASISTTNSTDSEKEDLVTYHVSRLSIALDNTLIYFMQLKCGDGVFIAPAKQETGNVHHLQRLLFENFRNAVELIHGMLQLSLVQREHLSNEDEGASKWTSRSLVTLKEHGMLFRWSPSENVPVFSYWVCGRLFLTPDPKECFVAYHESTPQHMVELAFRLAFGVHP